MSNQNIIKAAIAIKEAIDKNPTCREPLKQLAPEIHAGRNKLLLEFKNVTGMTIRRYRLETRMKIAAQMLSTGKYTIKQVSIACGHPNRQCNFSKIFKMIHKISPEIFVLQNLNKEKSYKF